MARAHRRRERAGCDRRHRGGSDPAAAARGCADGQHPGHAHRTCRRRARRLRPLRHQHHPPGRRTGPRHHPRRLPARAHRPRSPGVARRPGPGGRHRHRRLHRRVGGAPGGGADAGAASRSRRRRHVHDDLHLRHQRRTQGRRGAPRDGAVLGSRAGREIRPRRLRRVLPRDAAVPLQRGVRGLERGAGCGRRDGPRQRSRRPASCRTSVATGPPT